MIPREEGARKMNCKHSRTNEKIEKAKGEII